MSDILHRILATKKEELIVSKSLVSQSDIEALAQASLTDSILAPRGFINAIEAKIALGHAGVIAEIKQASPSRGILRDPFHPALIAQSYAKHGAACLSVSVIPGMMER
jgi:indole-3-glycerol phosphate synthase